ncbi:MAG: hypothetical protein U1F41_03905 [Burkholderiales bacterium]
MAHWATAVGWSSGLANTSGGYNVTIGFLADVGAGNLQNAVAIGANAVAIGANAVADQSNKVRLATATSP